MTAGNAVQAQMRGSLRSKKITPSTSGVVFDSVSIVPGSVIISGFDSTQFSIDYIGSVLYWLKEPVPETVAITYRVFSSRLGAPVYRYRFDSIANFFRASPRVDKAVAQTKERFTTVADFGALQYTGSFGRSLSVGNTQDAVVNGVFNLQISGFLADSIEMAAAITDNNIPIQPDGTTQNLNEFDRIWMRFKKPTWEVNIGDIDVRKSPTYFMSYYKRQQGLAVAATQQIGKSVGNKVFASGALAKGKFARNIFNGIEGNQGPYRLTGAANELFFVVLAGTERVWIDGKQIQRGEDQDYVINYNTAEITFTPRQLINKDARIQVEFEYADRNYLNSLIYLEDELQISEKFKFNIAYYANTDARNSPINQELNPLEKQFLSEIGDSIQNAFFPSAMPDSFDASKIQYTQIDTTVSGETYKAFQYYTTPERQLYNLQFVQVGENKGNYIPAFNGANGKVFQWVVPINGVPQGSYEPARFLVTPKKRAMLSMAAEWMITPQTSIQASAGFSTQDVNLFSSKDKMNDKGNGYRIDLNDGRRLLFAGKSFQLKSSAGYEYVDENFVPLERLRPVEFLRDWGLEMNAAAATEQIIRAQTGIGDGKGTSLQYAFQRYQRNNDYQGIRHQLSYDESWKGWQLRSIYQQTIFTDAKRNGKFLRPLIALDKTLKAFNNAGFGLQYQLEHNSITEQRSGNIAAGSFSFHDWRAYLASDQNNRNRWRLEWFSRSNRAAVGDEWLPQDVQNTISINTELAKSKVHFFRIQASYRNLTVKTSGINNLEDEQTLLGRAEYGLTLLKGALRATVLYELGAGQEQQRDFTYVEVQAGRGEYAWIDYNNDGIPQLNEFEVAIFPDQAKYIRIFTPTNRFVKATYNTFNYNLGINPRAIWMREKSGWKAWAAKFNLQTALQTNRKQVNDGNFQFNPFAGSIGDTSLLAANTNLSNNISFNRFSTKWGVDFTQLRNAGKAILTYGFETRINENYRVKLRKNFGSFFTATLSGRMGNQRLITPNPKFENRNYDISTKGISPALIFTNGVVFRAELQYVYSKKDGVAGAETPQATINTFEGDIKWNVLQKSVVTARMSYSHIGYNGPTNTTVTYIMLEALQPGKNLLWNTELTRRISNSFEISFQYEGRQSGDSKTVHIGRAALRAIL